MRERDKKEYKCAGCENMFISSEKNRLSKKYPDHCRTCVAQLDAKIRFAKHQIDLTTLRIDQKNFTGIDASGICLPLKMKFDFPCNRCKKNYVAALCFERKKIFPWFCKSCAITVQWEDESYRQIHIEEMTKALNKPDQKARLSLQSKKNWSDDDVRRRMLSKDHKAISVKAHETHKKNLLSGKTTLKVSHGKRCLYDGVQGKFFFRSTYELRMSIILDTNGFEWTYEKDNFSVCNDTKVYTPDFNVKNIGFIEVKGWWRDDAKEKYDSFLESYDIPIIVVSQKELIALEKSEVKIEDLFNKKNW